MGFHIDDIKASKELGEYLKSAREQADISIEEIQKRTKIRTKYLTAIENGEFSIIPGGDVYIKGFLKNYAESVGIESDTIIKLYKKIRGEPEKEKIPIMPAAQDAAVKLNDSANPKNEFKPDYKKIGIIVLSAIFVVSVIISVRALRMRSSPQDTVPPITQNLPADEIKKPPVENPTPAEEETEVMVEVIEDTKQNTVYVIDDDSIEVTINNVTARCWVLVYRDDNWEYEGILNTGESKSWTAENNINIRIGNPPAVNLVINDKDLGSPTGEARNFIFKRRT